MPLIGTGSIFTADEALDAVENVGVDLVAIGRELFWIINLLKKLKMDGKMKLLITLIQREKIIIT
ncbi:hypothetical protein ACVXZZ_11395 [Staphylococcus aureus]